MNSAWLVEGRSLFIVQNSSSGTIVLLARVVGNVVATVKNESLSGKTILVLQPIDFAGRDRGEKLLALDSVGAGAAETVYYCRGREASFPWYPDDVPVDATIVGIVDHIHVGRR
jgi:ethanolamine utilization protein EutN